MMKQLSPGKRTNPCKWRVSDYVKSFEFKKIEADPYLSVEKVTKGMHSNLIGF